MKIGVIQASSQKAKNSVLYDSCCRSVKGLGHEVINFGVFEDEASEYAYTEIGLMNSILLSSKAVDFIVTGCSSGQGMALACNMLPGILCGFIQNPQDAFLFGRINGGNAASFSLGLGYGWLGELNLEYSLEKLFDGEFCIGYPEESAERKKRDSETVKEFNRVSKIDICSLMGKLDRSLVKKILSKENVIQYILKHSKVPEINDRIDDCLCR